MKKLRLVTLSMLAIFALALAGNAAAYNATYTYTVYNSAADIVIDGTYGTPATGATAEWANSQRQDFGTNGAFRGVWSPSIRQFFLIETADATDDAGDYWQLCFDSSADSTTAPDANDWRVDITGHGASQTITYYEGTGSGWTAKAAPATASVEIAQAFTSSPPIAADHYILEIGIDKQSTDAPLGMAFATQISYYDAHTGGDGLQVWPPTSTNADPTNWGYFPYAQEDNPNPDVPEGFGLIAIVALTAVAVIGSAVFLRKRAVPKVGTRALI